MGFANQVFWLFAQLWGFRCRTTFSSVKMHEILRLDGTDLAGHVSAGLLTQVSSIFLSGATWLAVPQQMWDNQGITVRMSLALQSIFGALDGTSASDSIRPNGLDAQRPLTGPAHCHSGEATTFERSWRTLGVLVNF